MKMFLVLWIGKISEEKTVFNMNRYPVGPQTSMFSSYTEAKEYAEKVKDASMIDVKIYTIIKEEVIEK